MGNLSSFWVHFQDGTGITTTGANCNFVSLADSGGVGRLFLRGTGAAEQLKLSTRNAAGTYVDLVTSATGLWAPSVVFSFDMQVSYSATGFVNLYINGVLVLTYSGNVTTDSATSLSYLYLASPQVAGGNTMSEVIVADSDTRAMGLWLLNSSVAGNAQTFSGTGSNVNKSVINDLLYISAASAGLIEQFKTGGLALPGGTYTVATVKMSSRALVGTSGPQNLEYVTRVGSTDYVGGSWGPPVGSFGNDLANYMQPTNPATSAPWATSDLTASTFNYGVESVT
jgi:hypothetical protein